MQDISIRYKVIYDCDKHGAIEYRVWNNTPYAVECFQCSKDGIKNYIALKSYEVITNQEKNGQDANN